MVVDGDVIKSPGWLLWWWLMRMTLWSVLSMLIRASTTEAGATTVTTMEIKGLLWLLAEGKGRRGKKTTKCEVKGEEEEDKDNGHFATSYKCVNVILHLRWWEVRQKPCARRRRCRVMPTQMPRLLLTRIQSNVEGEEKREQQVEGVSIDILYHLDLEMFDWMRSRELRRPSPRLRSNHPPLASNPCLPPFAPLHHHNCGSTTMATWSCDGATISS